MLGRIKYEQINSMIEELNSVAVAKYKIIDTPVNKLKSDDMRRFNVSFLERERESSDRRAGEIKLHKRARRERAGRQRDNREK